MIVRCQPDDRTDVLAYLGTDYGKCLYFYLDLMQFGLDSPEVSVWKEVDGGRIAAMALIRPDFRITREHGKWFQLGERRFLATFHPSALLRDPSRRPEAFMDLREIRSAMRTL